MRFWAHTGQQLALVASLIVLTAASGAAQTEDTVSVDTRPTVAVLPFANYTGQQDAFRLVPMIEQEFWHNDFYIVRSARIRRTLRQYRIRTAGMIGAEDARLVANRWDVDYLLLGSLDVFRDDVIPEAGFSIRLVDVQSLQVVWAKTVAATGTDFTGLFGVGQIKSMPRLTRHLVREAVKDAYKSIMKFKDDNGPEWSAARYAVVTFDNYSGNRRAGEIISSMLHSEAYKKRLNIIEPGVAVEVFRSQNRIVRGGVDLELMQAIRQKHGVDLVITGSVDEFKPGRPAASNSFPEIEASGRVINTETGLVVASRDKERNGGDSELILGLGAERALGDLAMSIINNLMGDLLSDTKDEYAEWR